MLLTEGSFLLLDVLRHREIPSAGFAFQAPFGGDQNTKELQDHRATSTILGAGSMIPPAADLPFTIKKIVREVLGRRTTSFALRSKVGRRASNFKIQMRVGP